MTQNLATAETLFFLVYGRDPNLPLHQLLEPMQCFIGDPESRLLNLEAHQLALAIEEKTLDENCFRTAQKTMDREPPSFKLGILKTNNQENGMSSGDQDTGLFVFSMMDSTCTLKIKPQGRKGHAM